MLTFKSYGEVYSGEGCTKEVLGKIFSENKYRAPLFLYDSKIDPGDLLSYEFAGMFALNCSKEPTYDDLIELMKRLEPRWIKKNWDVVLVLGGGSAIDTAKALAVLLTNNGSPLNYKGFDKIVKPGVPVIAIPATLSGAEATCNASFIDTQTKAKMGINGRHMFAKYVVLDPQWLPAKDSPVFAGTFLDAITHAYESLVCKQANDLTKPLSEKALELLLSGDMGKIQMGAYLAGRALCNSGSGISGALSYALGVHYGVPHGIAGGIWLPDVMKFNGSDPDLEKTIRKYLEASKISTDLADYGVESVEAFHEHAKAFHGAFDQNPKLFDAETDGLDLIKKHWKVSLRSKAEVSQEMPAPSAVRRNK